MYLSKNSRDERSGDSTAYMISRGASGTHICWRCQLRLSRSLSTNLPSLTHFQGARLQHNFAESETPSTQSQRPQGARNDHDEDIPRARTKLKQNQGFKGTGAWHPLQKKAVSEHPLGRLHGFRGHRLREKRAELNVNSLGAPAEVIVLKDVGFNLKPLPQIEELKVNENVDILTRLDAERGLITQADVEENIDDCRPKTKCISWAELRNLQLQLVSGFTTSQLVKYIDARGRQQENGEEQHEVGASENTSKAIVRKTQWMPRVSETSDEFKESPLRGYDSEAFTPKQRLVLLLLRQCWQLEAQEVVESIGEVELEIPSMGLELLIEGRTPPLKLISNEFITSQEEKIEAFRSRGVVRITAPKEKSEAIVREIEATLHSIRSLTINLNALVSAPKRSKAGAKSAIEAAYEEPVLNELAQLTETCITRLPDNQISVSCIHAKPETHLSSKADVARRLLLTSSDLTNRTKTLQARKEIPEPTVAIKYHLTNFMSWRDQLRQWVRWTSATPKPPEPHKGADMTPPRGATEVLGKVDTIQREKLFPTHLAGPSVSVGQSHGKSSEIRPPLDTMKLPGDNYWDRKTFTATSAVVGHILHEIPVTPEVSTKLAEDAAAQRTMFHPAPVNISKLFGTMPFLNDLSTALLILRFIPSPWANAGPEVLLRLPPVEMRFAVDTNTKELQMKDVVAVIESTASDVMLPNRILDLRFQQRTMSRLCTLNGHRLPQISEFLEASRLNLRRGRLETPPGLTLPIATHLCDAQMSEPSQSSADESIDAEYIFGGLEYRSTLALDFKGWQLLYTSVEGGKADGRRGELSLMPWRVEEISSSNKSTAAWTEEYIEAAYDLVDTLASYDTAPKEVVSSSKPAHDQKRLSGLSNKGNLERNKAFQYFMKSVDFTTHHEMKDE